MLSLNQLKKIKRQLEVHFERRTKTIQNDTEPTAQVAEPEETFDPCDVSPVDASAVCSMLGTIESSSYTSKNPDSSASGRYQFVTETAHDVLKNMGDRTPEATWNECALSSSDKCKRVQDAMCNQYSSSIRSQLTKKGIVPSKTNMYMAWQQGAGGASVILKSFASGEPITNKDVLKRINNQGGVFRGIDNGRVFIPTIQKFMRDQGVDV